MCVSLAFVNLSDVSFFLVLIFFILYSEIPLWMIVSCHLIIRVFSHAWNDGRNQLDNKEEYVFRVIYCTLLTINFFNSLVHNYCLIVCFFSSLACGLLIIGDLVHFLNTPLTETNHLYIFRLLFFINNFFKPSFIKFVLT